MKNYLNLFSFKRTCYILFFICNISFLSAQEILFKDAMSKVESEIYKELELGNGPGVSISVLYKNHSYNKGFGIANNDLKNEISSDFLFMNASTSKVLVALAILRLEEKRKLSLDLSIDNYVEGLNSKIGNLTLNQLLSHTSGLVDRTNDFGPGGTSQHIKFSCELSKKDFFTDPGKVYSYSNIGYNIVGAVIESITEKDFNSAMKDLVFEMLGMEKSTYRIEEVNKNQLAFGHYGKGNNYTLNSKIPDNAMERASGMMFTTANEMNLLFKWLNSNSLNQSKIKDNLTKIIAQKDKTGANWKYGYGLFHSDYCDYQSIWHTGGIPGYGATIMSIPEKDFSIVVLTNGSNLNRWNIIKTTVESLFGASCNPKTNNQKLIEFSLSEMKNLKGTYSQGIGAVIQLKIINGEFYMIIDGEKLEVKKNENGKLITINNNEVRRSYSIFSNQEGKVEFLQYWVRAYPKI